MITPFTSQTKSEIFTIYNKMRAAARRPGDTIRIERLNKALGILQSKDYYQAERSAYLPTVEWCGCNDWEFRNAKRSAYTGGCKHMLAEAMVTEIAFMRAEDDVTHLVGIRTTVDVYSKE